MSTKSIEVVIRSYPNNVHTKALKLLEARTSIQSNCMCMDEYGTYDSDPLNSKVLLIKDIPNIMP